MNIRTGTFSSLFLAMLVAGLFGCAEFNYHLLEDEEVLTGTQLRQNWNNYIVYYRPNAGILYKLKNDKKIILPRKWVQVASESMVTDNTVFYMTGVRKILGQDGDLYGYVVYSYRDGAYVKIVNANTVELIFHYQAQEGR